MTIPLVLDQADIAKLDPGRNQPLSKRVLRAAENPAGPADEILMARIAESDHVALTILCRRHYARCFAVARQMLDNPADADEVVQDTFLRVWLNAGRWRQTEARFSSWMYRIVVNRALDRLRRNTPRCVPIELAADAISSDPNPEALTAGRELARLMAAAIAALPVRQRAALNLVTYQGLECAEAAAVMKISVGTMESLLVRGRRRLRAILADAARDPSSGRAGPAAMALEFVRDYADSGGLANADAEIKTEP